MPSIIGLELKCTNQEENGVGNDISVSEGEAWNESNPVLFLLKELF